MAVNTVFALLRIAILGALLLGLQVAADTVSLRILGTTDIHCCIEEGDGAEPGDGGWLRLAALIKGQRRQAGADRTILIDCGDTVQGTLSGRLSRGQVAADLLQHLAYDVWVPGNHELDFGLKRLGDLARQTSDMFLCANLEIRGEDRWVGFPKWRMLERGGARVAVIGATASYMGNWFWGDAYSGFRTQSVEAVLEECLPRIHREKPDLIVLAVHQGWVPTEERRVNEVGAIAERFAEIDVILGGHTHWDHAGRRIGPRSWYVQAGRHGNCLAVVDVRVDTEAHRVLQVESRLLEATVNVQEDADALAVAEPWLRETAKFAKRPVGIVRSAVSAEGKLGVDCATSELLSAAIAEAAGAVVVIHGRLSRHGLRKGVITEEDVFDLVPYENSIGVARLMPADLIAVIEEQVAKVDSYVACGLYGVVASLDGNGRVTALTMMDGEPVSGPLTVAFNSYTLAGGGGRFPVLRRIVRQEEVQLRDTGIQTHDALRAYLKRHSPIEGSAYSWLRFPSAE